MRRKTQLRSRADVLSTALLVHRSEVATPQQPENENLGFIRGSAIA